MELLLVGLGLVFKCLLEMGFWDGVVVVVGAAVAAGIVFFKLFCVFYYGVFSLVIFIFGIQQMFYFQGEWISLGVSSLFIIDSFILYYNEEDEEDDEVYDIMVEEQYGQMYIKVFGSYVV